MSAQEDAYYERRRLEIEREQQMVETVRSIAAELVDAAGYTWGWGDGYGGWVLSVVRDAARDAGLDTEVGSYEPSRRPKKQVIGNTLRRIVMERDAYRCVTCATHVDLTIDHIVPESKGGPTVEANLQTLCRSCNSRKGVS